MASETIHVDIRAVITLKNGESYTYEGDSITDYSASQTLSSGGLPVGAAVATQFGLTIENADGFTPRNLDGAKVEVYLSRWSEFGAEIPDAYIKHGEWYVTSADVNELSKFCTVYGIDAMEYKLAKSTLAADLNCGGMTFAQVLQHACSMSGVSLVDTNFLNANLRIPTSPAGMDWYSPIIPMGTTARQIVSLVAVCAFGYAVISPDGALEMVTIASDKHAVVRMDPDSYTSLSETCGEWYTPNRFVVYSYDNDERPTEYADADSPKSPVDTVLIRNNPLTFREVWSAIIQHIRYHTPIEFESMDVVYIGDLIIHAGERMAVTALDGIERYTLATSASMSYDSAGVQTTLSCSLPSSNGDYTEYDSGIAKLTDKSGNIVGSGSTGGGGDDIEDGPELLSLDLIDDAPAGLTTSDLVNGNIDWAGIPALRAFIQSVIDGYTTK